MKKPKQSAESRRLQEIQLEREKQLRIERARETSKAFSDNLAFRRKLRGIFSLLSGGFKGFPGGTGGSGGAGSAGGGASLSGAIGGSGGGAPGVDSKPPGGDLR